jgi:hypothetical protein
MVGLKLYKHLLNYIIDIVKNYAQVETAQGMAEELKAIIDLTRRVIEQTTRRAIHGKSVQVSKFLFFILFCHRSQFIECCPSR